MELRGGCFAYSASGVSWTVNDYDLDRYDSPFAELILINGAAHIPHDYHAEIDWEFFRHFRRNAEGEIEEIH